MSGWVWVKVGAGLGFLAVALGAFGAHGLKERLDGLGTLAHYQTAVQYHTAHALAVLAVGLLAVASRPSRALDAAGWSFLAGVVLFSGSLYVLALTGDKWYGRVTPFGGLALLAGWLALAAAGPGRVTPTGGTAAERRSEAVLAEERR